jgi:hypothetical protein
VRQLDEGIDTGMPIRGDHRWNTLKAFARARRRDLQR